MNKPFRSSTEAAQYLRQTRAGYKLSQSDVAAYMTYKQRRTWNQARINEFENEQKPIPVPVILVLSDFFKQVEQLRQQRRPWTDVFNH